MHSFKAPGRGDWGFCIPAMLIPQSSQPPPNQFSCLSQNTSQEDQESPQNKLHYWNKIPENFAGIVVNGAKERLSLFITLPMPNL